MRSMFHNLKLVGCILMLSGYIQPVLADDEDFDPANPADPSYLPMVMLKTDPADVAYLTGKGRYTTGTKVTINTSSKTEDYVFSQWTDESDAVVSTSPLFTYTVGNDDASFIAHYTRVYALDVTCNPVSAGVATGTGRYQEGQEVILTATAATGYRFVGWSVDGTTVSEESPFCYTMPASAKMLVANFEELKPEDEEDTRDPFNPENPVDPSAVEAYHYLYLVADPAEAGSFSQGSGERVVVGSKVELTAYPNVGYQLDGWQDEEGEILSHETTLQYEMPDRSVSLTALFSEKSYSLTLACNPSGSCTFNIESGLSYKLGTVVSLEAIPAEDFRFDGWYDSNNRLLSTSASYNYTMPAAETVLTAKLSYVEPVVLPDFDPENPADPSLNQLTIIDGEPFTVESSFSIPIFSYIRDFNNTQWQPLLLPVSLKYEHWRENFEVAEINGVYFYDTDNDGSIDRTEITALTLKEGAYTIPNMPYLIRALETGEGQSITRYSCKVYPTEARTIECSSTMQTFRFVGTYTGMSSQEMVEGGYYFLSGGRWYHAASDNAVLKPYRFYLSIEDKENGYDNQHDSSTGTMSPMHLVVDGEDVTDIPFVTVHPDVNNSQPIILSRLNIGLPAGLYSISGRQVIVR